MERSFNSAKASRLPANFRTVIGNAEEVNRGTRDKLRGIARNLENNSDIAAAVANAFERNVIGSGITLQIKTKDEDLNKNIEDLFKKWSSPKNCGVTGELSFLDMQNIIMDRIIYDGGILVKKVIDKNSEFPLKLQLIEVDEFDNTAQATSPKTRCNDGIETDEYNKPLFYHIKKHDLQGYTLGSEKIPAADIIYLRKIKRPSQIREISQMARTMDRVVITDEYLDSVAQKEQVAACLAAFITKSTPSASGLGRNSKSFSESGAPLKNITPGTIQYLNTGEDVSIVTPTGQSSDTEKFVRTEQRLLSAGIGLSYETVARDLSNVNYSSARQNLLEDKETYKRWQRFIIEHFCEEVFSEFIKAIMLKGIIAFKNEEIPHEWVGSGWSWIDPLKEAKADETAIANNLSTLQRICAERGQDWKEVLTQRQKELEFMRELGIIKSDVENEKLDTDEEGK